MLRTENFIPPTGLQDGITGLRSYAMNHALMILFRVAARLSAVFSCLNGGIFAFDSLMHPERLETRYQIVTMVVAMAFGLIGVGIFGLERGLARIYRFQTAPDGLSGAAELVTPWRVVLLVLGVALFMLFALMLSIVVATIERLLQGDAVFG